MSELFSFFFLFFLHQTSTPSSTSCQKLSTALAQFLQEGQRPPPALTYTYSHFCWKEFSTLTCLRCSKALLGLESENMT